MQTERSSGIPSNQLSNKIMKHNLTEILGLEKSNLVHSIIDFKVEELQKFLFLWLNKWLW